MSVKVHEAFCLDSFMDRLTWWDDFLGDQLKDEWSIQGTGSVVVVDQQTGGIVRITTAPAMNNLQLIRWGGIGTLLVSKKVTIEWRFKLLRVTDFEARFQLFFNATNLIDFSIDTNAEAVYQTDTILAGASTKNATNISPDTDWHILRFECFPTGQVHYYYDGVEVNTSPHTTNIPTDYLEPLTYIRTRSVVLTYVDVDYIVIRQEI